MTLIHPMRSGPVSAAIFLGKRIAPGVVPQPPVQSNTFCRRAAAHDEIPVRATSARLKRYMDRYMSLKGCGAINPIVGQIILIAGYFVLEDINVTLDVEAAPSTDKDQYLSVRKAPPEYLPFFAALTAPDESVGWDAILDLACDLSGLSRVSRRHLVLHDFDSCVGGVSNPTLGEAASISNPPVIGAAS